MLFYVWDDVTSSFTTRGPGGYISQFHTGNISCARLDQRGVVVVKLSHKVTESGEFCVQSGALG